MNDQHTEPASEPDNRNVQVYVETPELRATVISGLRTMAQFLEDNPQLPCPQFLYPQYSYLEPLDLRTYERVPVPDAEKIAVVQAAADHLGVQAEIDEDSAVVHFEVAARTTYTIRAKLHGGEQA